jgi:outer membrane receptor protein involved in Fe transport
MSVKTHLKVALCATIYFLFTAFAFGQSTGAIQGTVTDTSGATVPNASVTVKGDNNGVNLTLATDAAGIYFAPSLPAGDYSVEVKANGLATTNAKDVTVSVATTTTQNFALTVASTSQVVEITGAAPLVDTSTASVGSVVNQRTVQEIPLNGRHFVDLSLLTVGTVTPPANGFLTAPLRGQGSFAFNSAGAREDSINFMVNGINLSDPNQNQVTFQPTINTIDEFIISNSTFSAEYGRNSGSIVNIATRAGSDTWHGEAYEFARNSYFDARNFSDPTRTSSGAPFPEAPFIRNQFGGDGGGAIRKDKDFIYMSYEGLRQRQAVSLSATTLTAAQVTQAMATSDAAVKALLPLIPAANSGTNQFVGSAVAPVNIEQGTTNYSHIFSDANRFNFYYAIQQDQRNEPPSTDANSFPNMGDQRNGRRQLITLSDSWVISPTLVNELRLGGNRIHIVFAADNTGAAPAYGINSGVTAPIGLPQITVTGAFEFGGISGFPQGRGDDTAVISDTLSWVHGHHTVKFGGEYRRANTDNFSYTPGTFTFPNVTAFLADQASAFSVTPSNRSNRTYNDSVGLFVTDSWKIMPRLTLNLGVRYDFYGTPTEAENRFVVFNPATDSLVPVNNGSGGPSLAYNNSNKNFEPRLGFAFDPFGNSKTVVRGAYAIMTDQPTLGLVTGLAANPPYAFPVSSTAAGLSLMDAYTLAGGSVSPFSVAHNYHDAYVSEYNFGIEQQIAGDFKLTAQYVGSKGTDLNIERNYNQLLPNGTRPYPALSASSPIDPGLPLTNILVYESDGNSNYNALWLTASKRFARGLQFNTSYSWSKSIDDNSRNNQGLVIQDSNNIRGDRGLSDFDARNRFVVSGIYELPFKGNRLKEGWQISMIQQLQSGNPINFHTSNTALTGSANLRPSVTGPVITGISPGTNGAATSIDYIQNPSVFIYPGAAFGNLGRNVVIGPGVENLDFALVKNTKIRERLTWQIRVDAFDLFNHANLAQPVSALPTTTVGSPFVATSTSTFGLITGGTRFTGGDFGTSRQIQLAMKLIF